MTDEPGDRAMRLMVAGVDIKPIVRDAVSESRPLLERKGLWDRACRMSRWRQVELYLGLYERTHFKADVPGSSRVDRALWYVAREMALFNDRMCK